MRRSIEQVKADSAKAGKYFFSPGAMAFFNSRIETDTWERRGGGEYFVTSEQYDDTSPRRYKVRRAFADGAIGTVGEDYTTLDEAVAAIAALNAGTLTAYNA